MNKKPFLALIQLVSISILLWLLQSYLVHRFFPAALYIPVWAIYCFNAVVVLFIYGALKLCHRYRPEFLLQTFIGLTVFKMLLAILFLWPLFLNRSDHASLEVVNFFIPYFLYLIIEIRALNSFLQNS